MDDSLHLQFDIMCIIVALLIICPIIVKPVRQHISNSLIIIVSGVLICLGTGVILYQQKIDSGKITFVKENKQYIYLGNAVITAGMLSIIFLFLHRIGS
jgi:hypothetical protein